MDRTTRQPEGLAPGAHRWQSGGQPHSAHPARLPPGSLPHLLRTIKAWLSSLLLHRSSAVASSTASPSWKMALMPS